MENKSMSGTSTIHAHVSYELIEETDPQMVVIEFLTRAICTPAQAHELGEQLRSLIRPDLPHRFVIDFHNVRALGSTAFGEIVAFVRDLQKAGGQVKVCGIDEIVKLGATLIGLDDVVEFTNDRRSAINDYVDVADRGRLITRIAQFRS
jgi:anti-anti-sigma regulatory factor